MTGTESFFGDYLNAVDAKGRVSLPASFRTVIDRRLEAAGDSADRMEVLLGDHERHACLVGYDRTHQSKLRADVEARFAHLPAAEAQDAASEYSADLFGSFLPFNYDGAGRLVLSAGMRSTSGIGDLAFFVGNDRVFEIWNPETFLETVTTRPRLTRRLQQLMAERGR